MGPVFDSRSMHSYFAGLSDDEVKGWLTGCGDGVVELTFYLVEVWMGGDEA